MGPIHKRMNKEPPSFFKEPRSLKVAMLAVHSCTLGELGSKNTGGMSVYVRELARALGDQGHVVDIFTRVHDDCHQRITAINENVRLIHLPAGPSSPLPKLAQYRYLPEFASGLDDFRRGEGKNYDLVHSHYWLSGLVGSDMARKWGVPHFMMFHTLGEVKRAIRRGEAEPELRLEAERQAAMGSQRIIAATVREKEELESYYQAPPEVIAVIPCGVNTRLFKPSKRKTTRMQLGFDPAEEIILFVGRFDPLKGLDRLLEALAELAAGRSPDGPGLKLILIGGDDQRLSEERKIRQMSQSLGLGELTIFTGRVRHEDLPMYYSAAEVFVLPSFHESFGLAALEALACGTPVAAFQVGGMDEIIRTGENGYLIDDRPGALADGIASILAGSRQGAYHPETVRASVAGLSWSNMAEAVISEYRRFYPEISLPLSPCSYHSVVEMTSNPVER